MINTNSFKKFFAALIFMLFLAINTIPLVAFADESPQTKNGQTGITYECGDGVTAGNCTFDDLIRATKKIVNWGTTFALLFSVIVIAYVGGEYMLYADNASKRAAASGRLWKVAQGMLWMLGAWLIVTLITNALLKDTVQGLVPLG
jgi:hypothetical protein